MSSRRKPNGVRSRSRSRPNFGYAGCGASSAIAAPDPSRSKNAVTRIACDGETSLRPLRINVAFWWKEALKISFRCSSRQPIFVDKDHRSSRWRSEEHTSELQSLTNLVCRLLLEKKKRYGTDAGMLFNKEKTPE